jgi:hypothetical protein
VPNFFIGNPKSPYLDSLIRFPRRTRNEAYWTPAKKAFIFQSNIPSTYGSKRFCILLYILNNCTIEYERNMERHNNIQARLVEAIRKGRNIKDRNFNKKFH